VRDRDDDRINAEVQTILRFATVNDLKARAAELFELCKNLEPSPDFLPPLSADPDERMFELLKLLLRERERSRKLLMVLGSA
jgi:hypothetical protein